MISSLIAGRRSPRPLFALSAAAVLAASPAPVAPAHAVPVGAETLAGAPGAAGSAPATAAGSHTVTLVTGDRVTLTPSRHGQQPFVLVEPRDPARPTGFSLRRENGRVIVIPRDVAALVPDVLDPALFDVTGLIEMRYDDQHRDDLPLIVRRASGVRSADVAPLSTARPLTSIGASAASLDKSRAAAFGAELAGAGSAVRARAAAGITKVWLDQAVRASSLDRYLEQVRAPAAWATGLDGSGVTVAVLDTGVDTGHPALVGQVTAEADFTGTAAADGNGHGTHVASLVAGTGAGADGARRGIAPAAALLSGKVLGDDGYGQWSWVIAGMEWAVSQGADIVNLSLSGRAGQVDDPAAVALDTLTAQTGTLFVAAAGNDGGLGRSPFTIGTPGIAASAVTVGAVTADDRGAGFSSEGPTRGSYRLKPDLAAPGVNVPGARAGAREADLYVSMSGTSQATPLVAGAAALLMQQHPEWTWQEVKAQLVGTADDIAHQTSWSHGGGRLDLAQATGQQLHANLGSLDFGYLRHPDEGKRSKTLTLTNPGAEPVTVTLRDEQISGGGTVAPEQALTAHPATLTVPAGGNATTTLTLDPGQLGDELWHGTLTVAAGGQELLGLPIGLYDEPERYDLSLRVLDRTGAPYGGADVTLFNAETGGFRRVFLDDNGAATVRVEPGRFSIFTMVSTPAAGDLPETFTIAGAPEVTVDHDTTYVIDARTAEQLRPPTVHQQPVRVVDAAVSYARHSDGGRGYTEMVPFTPEQIAAGRIFITPTVPVTEGNFEVAFRWRLEPEGAVRPGEPEVYELLLPAPRFTDPLSPNLGPTELLAMARVENTFTGLTEPGRYLVGRAHSTTQAGLALISYRPIDVPARRVELLTAHPDAFWRQCLAIPERTLVRVCDPQYRPYVEGERLAPVFGAALHPVVRDSWHDSSTMFVEVGVGDGAAHSGKLYADAVRSSQLRLSRDGQLLGETTGLFRFFPAPAGVGRYRLEHSWALDPALVPVANQARTVWEFTSGSTDPYGPSTIPPLLELAFTADVDQLGHVAAQRSLRLDLTVSHLGESSAGVTGARLWYSVDDGATWAPLETRGHGEGSYQATVPGNVLRAGGRLSLRATATDAAGNSIDQTVIGILPVR